MKCRYCDAPVTLEDEFCPYCGALNEAARQHIEDRRSYDRDYEETREKVYEKIKKQSRMDGIYILIIMLILVNVLVWVFRSSPMMLNHLMNGSKSRYHRQENIAELEELLTKKDYRAIGRLSEKDTFQDYSDEMIKYHKIVGQCGFFEQIQSNLFYLIYPNCKGSYKTKKMVLHDLSEVLYYFYDGKSCYPLKSNEEYYMDKGMTVILAMNEELRIELKNYFGFSEEELDSFEKMDQYHLSKTLRKKVRIDEEDEE